MSDADPRLTDNPQTLIWTSERNDMNSVRRSQRFSRFYRYYR